jgi:hypothetical protein
MPKNWLLRIPATLAVACLLSCVASAQVNTSTIAGIVTDPSGGAVGSATVTLTGRATAQTRTVQTSDVGEYTLPQLPPGSYDLKIEAPGFQTAVSKEIVLEIAQRATVDIILQLGNTSSTIEVSAQANILRYRYGFSGTNDQRQAHSGSAVERTELSHTWFALTRSAAADSEQPGRFRR